MIHDLTSVKCAGSARRCARSAGSVEGLELVGLDGRLILVQVGEGVLSAVVMGIVVRINRLRLQARDCIKLLDRGCPETGQCSEHSTFNFCDLRILNGVDKGVL